MALYEVLEDGTIVPKAGHTVGNLRCLRPVLLWENDSPALSFPQRTIEDITPNNCDYFEIGYRYDTSNNFQKSDLIKADAGVRGLLSFVNTPNIMFARALTINSKTSISFSASYRGNGSSESMDNTTIIPLYVIGYTKEPAMIYTGKELFAGNGINIEDGVISQSIIPKPYWHSGPGTGTSYTGTNHKAILTTTVTTKGGRIFASAFVQAYVNANIGYLDIRVDGKSYGTVCTNSNSKIGLAVSAITPELSAGVHTVTLGVYCQNSSNVFYLPTYNTGSFTVMEV